MLKIEINFVTKSLFVLVLSVNCFGLIRHTVNGPIDGILQTSSLGQKYFAFKGIPYAEPPITGIDYNGKFVDRRFKAPVELRRHWNEPLKVHNYGDACMPSIYSNNDSQVFVTSPPKTSENCLFLNIYEPDGGRQNKTVLVYIHGGGFTSGDAGDFYHGPDFLLSEDNIVVTIQYRLGIFGFLNLGTREYSGNMGLKDQQLALKWIHENIEYFSGNKHEILLFGESAGGASVGFQLLSEKSRRYYNRAYLSSSSAFSHYALTKSNNLQGIREWVKISGTNKLIEYLKTADSGFLATQYPFDFLKTLTLPFVPTIERSNSVDAFITEAPEEVYDSKHRPIKDVMFSFNSKEILAFRPNFIGKQDSVIKENIQDSEIDLPFEGFNKTVYPNEYKQCLEILKTVYFPDTNDTNAIEIENIHLMSDSMFDDSILKAVILQSIANTNNADKTSHKNTFLFRFSANSDINTIKFQKGLHYDGAAHSDDFCYYFHCHMMDQRKLYDEHLKRKDKVYDAIMRMVRIITNFARTGNPSLKDDTPFRSCEPPERIFCQEISNEPTSSVTTNIKKQLHYKTWRKIEEIYKNLGKYENSHGLCSSRFQN